jgi:hypothetical protein
MVLLSAIKNRKSSPPMDGCFWIPAKNKGPRIRGSAEMDRVVSRIGARETLTWFARQFFSTVATLDFGPSGFELQLANGKAGFLLRVGSSRQLLMHRRLFGKMPSDDVPEHGSKTCVSLSSRSDSPHFGGAGNRRTVAGQRP